MGWRVLEDLHREGKEVKFGSLGALEKSRHKSLGMDKVFPAVCHPFRSHQGTSLLRAAETNPSPIDLHSSFCGLV